MLVTKAGPRGQSWKVRDRWGGLFVPVPGKRQKPAYTFGGGPTRDVLFQCPVTGIPTETWDLLCLWWQCRLLRALPAGGGFLDQPKIVQLSFPIFEALYQGVEGQKGDPAERAAALAVGSMVKLMRGGR